MNEKEIKDRLSYYISDNRFANDEKVDMCFEEAQRMQEDAFNAGRERIGFYWNDRIRNWVHETFQDYKDSLTKK